MTEEQDSTSEDRHVRIVHLSDLHCPPNKLRPKKKSHWLGSMQCVADAVRAVTPDVIVVTGDLMDIPTQSAATVVGDWLKRLCRDIQDSSGRTCYGLCIPGNHDYWSTWGNKMILRRSKVWHRNARRNCFHYPDTSSFKELLRDIYSDLQVALFPFDSNRITKIGFAKGHVDDIMWLADKRLHYEEKDTDLGYDYDSAPKIALLHHHVLPLPNVGRLEQNLESFMLLDNSYEFLNALLANDIDFVLHGHKHRHGLAEYRGYIDGRFKTLTVISSGSSSPAKVNAPDFGVLDIHPHGLVEYSRRIASAGSTTFEKRDTLTLRHYDKVRQMHSVKGAALPKIYQECIEFMRHKRMHIQLTEDGTAYVNVSYQDIRWKNDLRAELIVTDYLRGDVGRIRGQTAALYSGRFKVKPTDTTRWSHPNADNGLDPFQPDGFFHSVSSTSIDSRETACCELGYQILNGFCIYQEDLDEIYQCVKDKKIDGEVCSIEVNAPTSSLELTVSFPNAESYPSEESVHVHAWSNPTDQREERFSIMQSDYSRLRQEEHFLVDEAAIQFKPEVKQISFAVRHPQPGVTYSLRWALNRRRLTEVPYADQGKIDELRSAFREPGDERVKRFLERLRNDIAATLWEEGGTAGDDAESIGNWTDIVAFGLDFENGCFALSIQNQPYKRIRLGRGVVGAAWRRQSPVVFVANDKSPDRPEPEKAFKRILSPNCVISLPVFYPIGCSVDVDRDLIVGFVSIIEHHSDHKLTRMFDPAAETGLSESEREKIEATRRKLIRFFHKRIERNLNDCFIKEM